MANKDHETNGVPHLPEGTVEGLLPGTTFPRKTEAEQGTLDHSSTPSSFDGPQVNGRSTTVTLLTPQQLAKSPLLPSLVDVIILAFRHQAHEKDGLTVVKSDRFQYDGQLLDELGTDLGTFTYVVHYTDTNGVIATASAKRYMSAVEIVEPPPDEREKYNKGNTFKRFWPVAEDTEAWELSTMAVASKVQKQGLAGYLMNLAEDEVRRRFRAANPDISSRKLVLMITSIKEVNGAFYSKRGFTLDYERSYERGHLGSEMGFTIIHMSKPLRLEGGPGKN